MLSSLKKIAFTIAIAILFPLLVHYGIEVLYPSPEKQAAIAAIQLHEKNAFLIQLIIGITVIIIGTFIEIDAIGSGLILGGLFALLSGYIDYWPHISNTWHFISLLIAFIFVVFFAFKKLK